MQSASNSQRKAICHGSGPMLVMAGPGSGKTFVMVQRILYLIRERKIPPEKILVISFSKASAIELQERFIKENICESTEVTFGTFHAVFFHILKETYHYTVNDIIRLKEKYEILSTILLDPKFENKEIQITKENRNEKIQELLSKISFYKNKDKRSLEETKDTWFISVFHEYNKIMHAGHRLDFDDMGLLCLELLKRNEEVRNKWQSKFQYILIDEFQDINEVQFRTISLLAGEQNNLFAVGDDDQAIYSFRGASPGFMIEFERYFPKAKTVLLETNYRCSDKIVEKSVKVIEKNKYRLPKKITAFHQSKEEVRLNAFPNPFLEYEYLADRIEELRNKGTREEEICCIFRTNANMMPLVDALLRRKISICMKEQCDSLFKTGIGKDILHYLKFVYGGKRRSDFIKIMNKPMRYLSRNACEKEVINWDELLSYYGTRTYMHSIIEEFRNLEKWMLSLDLYGAVHYLRKAGGYEKYLKEECEHKNLCWEEEKAILEFIHQSMRGISSVEAWEEKIKTYEDNLLKLKEKKNGVQLMTMHACKGLEFDVVFLPDCNEGKVPHNKAVTEEEIEEERRMFYVAMTRAKKLLEILYVEDPEKKFLQKSRFLAPLLEETEKNMCKRVFSVCDRR